MRYLFLGSLIIQNSPTYYCSLKPTPPSSSSRNFASRNFLDPFQESLLQRRRKVSTSSRKNRRRLRRFTASFDSDVSSPFLPVTRRVSRISSVMQISWKIPAENWNFILRQRRTPFPPPRLRYAYETIAPRLALTRPPVSLSRKRRRALSFWAARGEYFFGALIYSR